MKIAVFSDSHGRREEIAESIRSQQPEMVLHLGDYDEDCLPLIKIFPAVEFMCVCGNGDFYSRQPVSRRFQCMGKRIWMTHGHQFSVKSGTEALFQASYAAGDDIVLFGHTHKALITDYRGIHVMNPGSIGTGLSKSYGLIQIGSDGVDCRIIERMKK